jgi:hypothetical protein
LKRALKSDSAPPRGGAWETCRAGPTQRRKEIAYGGRARSRKEGKGGCPSAGFAPLEEVQKSGETEKAWDTVPAWVGQVRFLRTLTYESLAKRVQHANVQRARRNILKTHLSRQQTNIKETFYTTIRPSRAVSDPSEGRQRA